MSRHTPVPGDLPPPKVGFVQPCHRWAPPSSAPETTCTYRRDHRWYADGDTAVAAVALPPLSHSLFVNNNFCIKLYTHASTSIYIRCMWTTVNTSTPNSIHKPFVYKSWSWCVPVFASYARSLPIIPDYVPIVLPFLIIDRHGMPFQPPEFGCRRCSER